jgi:hypothetical protein
MSGEDDAMTLVLDELAAQTPPAPEWDYSFARAVRLGRHRRRSVFAACGLLVVALVVFGVLVALQPSSASLTASGPRPSTLTTAKLAGASTAVGVVFGDTWTTTGREGLYVGSSGVMRSDLARVGLRGQVSMHPGPGYLFELTGSFRCSRCAHSTGHSGALHPAAIFGWMSANGETRQFVGGTTSTYDLGRLGSSFEIPLASTAPVEVPIVLRSSPTDNGRGVAGVVTVSDEHGAVVTTVDVPASGKTTLTVDPGQYYSFSATHRDGRPCEWPLNGTVSTDRIPVVGDVLSLADLLCA